MRRTYTAVISTLAAAGVASATAGCQIIIGVDDTTEVRPDAPMTGPDAPGAPDAMPPDAGPLVVARVRAEGLLGPVMVRLQAGAVDETITVDADGTAAFPTVIDNGGAYAVTLVGGPACALGPSATGTAAGDVTVDLACQGATRLTALTLDTLTGTQPTLVDGTFTYTMAVSELQQLTRVTASPRSPAATMTVQGVATAAGVASGPVGLTALTSNVTVVVDHPLSAALRSTYTVNVARTTAPAHGQYGKQFPQSPDALGWSMDLDGDRLIVAACNERGATDPANNADTSAHLSGVAYVYVRQGNTWVYEDYLKAPNAQGLIGGDVLADQAGQSVAISGDRAVIGAHGEDSGNGNQSDNSVIDAGAAYVYRREGADWVFEAYLKSPYPITNGQFGTAVDISGDTIVVGARNEPTRDGAGAQVLAGAGQVHVYRRSGTTWTREATLDPDPVTGVNDRLGVSVAIDGDTVAAGVGLGGFVNPGAARIYTRSGTTWSFQQQVAASDGHNQDWFGFAVGLDGNTLVVTAPEVLHRATSAGTSSDPGAAYVFTRSGDVWTQTRKLTASNGDADDEFGRSVAIAGDLIAIGAHREDGIGTGVPSPDTANSSTDQGAVYLYRRSGALWSEIRYVKATMIGTSASNDGLGTAVTLGRDGFLVVGASGEASSSATMPDETAVGSGAFYVLR